MRLSFALPAIALLSASACDPAPAPLAPSRAEAQIPALPDAPPATFQVTERGPISPPDCRGAPAMGQAASDNAASLTGLEWTPLGTAERGWQVYEPLIAHEIGTACPAASPAFAEALARWQRRRRLPPDGRMTPQAFAAMYQVWHARRPFAHVNPADCPPAPAEAELATASASESYGSKPMRLKPGALDAFRRMAAAARASDPAIAADPRTLRIFSAFRDPVADLERCIADGACDNRRRTWCSAHRTGTAVDVYLGQAPGFGPDSTAYESRLYLSRSPAYRWLVANAGRYGFVNYAYEPWHWEWTGDPALPSPGG